MQYSNCWKCANHHPKCRVLMAQTIHYLDEVEHILNMLQTGQHQCKIKIDYSCENFVKKGVE